MQTTRFTVRGMLQFAALVAALALAVSGASGARTATNSELASCRGASQGLCSFSQTCLAYARLSGNCAGVPNNRSCSTCSNATTKVNYLDDKVGDCMAGLQYGAGPPANVNCGNLSQGATCQNQVCTGTNFNGLPCSQPNQIVNQTQ